MRDETMFVEPKIPNAVFKHHVESVSVVFTDSCIQLQELLKVDTTTPKQKLLNSLGSFHCTIKMKGLLKGLRFISHIFDTSSKEPEMQIGYPTDVKHVAHIGWDGPVSTPSWMKEFATVPNFSSGPITLTVKGEESNLKVESHDFDCPRTVLSKKVVEGGSRSLNW